MKYLKLLVLGFLNMLLFLLSSSEQEDKSNTKQIDWLDNPDSDPYHDGDWKDYNGNIYSRSIDGNHYDQTGRKWDKQ